MTCTVKSVVDPTTGRCYVIVRSDVREAAEPGRLGQRVAASEVRSMSSAGLLACAGCGGKVAYREGPVIQPHWTHVAPSSGGGGGGGAMSLWHSDVQHRVFESAAGHEVRIPGARIDAVVERDGVRTAVEVQRSPIACADVERRHQAHRDAGMSTTLWVVDVAGRWGRRAVPGDPNALVLCTEWIVELLAVARAHRDPDHNVVVVLAAPGLDQRQAPAVTMHDRLAGEDQMVLVQEAAMTGTSAYTGGAPRAAAIRWSQVWDLSMLQAWCDWMEPHQMRTADKADALRMLDLMPTLRVRRPTVIDLPRASGGEAA